MKNDNLSIVFSVQGTGGSLTGPYPENRVGDQDIGSPGRPVSSGLQVQKIEARTFPVDFCTRNFMDLSAHPCMWNLCIPALLFSTY